MVYETKAYLTRGYVIPLTRRVGVLTSIRMYLKIAGRQVRRKRHENIMTITAMKDALFIQQMLEKGKEAGEKVKAEFSALSPEQLNWKPAPESWSIGQCLDHLIVSDCLYFPALKKIAAGKYEMTTWEKWNPFSVLFGRMLVNQLQENVKKKVKAPRVFLPSASRVDAGILERFQKHQDTLLEYIAACKTADLDRTHITSPVSKFVTYSLRNAIKILVHHQHRHIGQAIRVKQTNVQLTLL